MSKFMSASGDKAALFRDVPVSRAVLSLAVPTVISQLVAVAYNMADTFFIGQLNDPAQVAAATISMPVFIFLTGIANLFGIGGAAMISRCLGAGDRARASRCSAFSFWSAAVIAFVYGVILFCVRDWLLPILGADADTAGYTGQYVFWTVTVGAVPTVLNALLAHLIRSEGYSREASFGVGMGGVLNIALDPLFIFAFDMNIAGAALATMLSNLIATLYFLLFLRKLRGSTVISLRPALYTLRERIPGEVLAGGLPSFIMTFMSTISNAVLNNLIASYSKAAIAGMGIAKKIDFIAFAVAQGMTQGVLPLVAYNYASGDRARMKASIRTALAYTLGIAMASLAILYFAAYPIVGLFINDPETVFYGEKYLRIICFVCPTTALNFMVITVFQATKQKAQSLFLSVLRKGALDVPFMFLMNSLMGVEGIPWATPIADGLALVIAGFLFVPFMRRQGRE